MKKALCITLTLLPLFSFFVFGCATNSTSKQRTNITLKNISGFHIGGEWKVLSGLPIKQIQTVPGGPTRPSDPNGEYQVGQMYAQYFQLAEPKSKYPLLLWHGGGLTGVTWENTPDGRSGWLNYFLRHGHDVCVSDAVERGRATWARYPEINPSEPEHRTIRQAWSIFRFGPADGFSDNLSQLKTYNGQQFPVETANQFAKQFVARWTTSNAWTQKAYGELINTIGPCVILAHSQGCYFAIQATLNAPHKVKAVILLEPTGGVNPADLDLKKAKGIPHLIIWGDYIDQSSLWQGYRANSEKYTSALRASGAQVDTIDLTKIGIYGNSHMLMMDKNSDQIAALVQDWIIKQSLMK